MNTNVFAVLVGLGGFCLTQIVFLFGKFCGYSKARREQQNQNISRNIQNSVEP